MSPVRSSPSPPEAQAPARAAAGPGRPAAPAAGPPAGPAAGERLLGISEAAARAGVSARALRYYQQIGLLVPARTTPGGMRRYSADDLTRVARIRELQALLGLNLEEIALVLRNEDRLAEIRLTYRDERTSDAERRALLRECLALQQDLRGTVQAKRDALTGFLADLDGRISKAQGLLAAGGAPPD